MTRCAAAAGSAMGRAAALPPAQAPGARRANFIYARRRAKQPLTREAASYLSPAATFYAGARFHTMIFLRAHDAVFILISILQLLSPIIVSIAAMMRRLQSSPHTNF